MRAKKRRFQMFDLFYEKKFDMLDTKKTIIEAKKIAIVVKKTIEQKIVVVVIETIKFEIIVKNIKIF